MHVAKNKKKNHEWSQSLAFKILALSGNILRHPKNSQEWSKLQKECVGITNKKLTKGTTKETERNGSRGSRQADE